MKVRELIEALKGENEEKEIVIDCYLQDRSFIAETTGYDTTEDHFVLVTELLNEQKMGVL